MQENCLDVEAHNFIVIVVCKYQQGLYTNQFDNRCISLIQVLRLLAKTLCS